MAYLKEKKIAIQAVWQASDLAHKMQGRLEALDVVNKEDFSPVTITDFSVQALVNRHLMEAFPNDEIMGEEDSLFLRNPQHQVIKEKVVEQIERIFPQTKEQEILDAIDKGGSKGGGNRRFWVLDPIDGTRGFILKEQYAIALALIENGEIVLGVLGCPRLSLNAHKKGGLFVAVKGEGCFLVPYDTQQEVVAHVSSERTPKGVIYCEPHKNSQTHSHSTALAIAKKLKAHPRPFRLDSQCKYALVAQGEAAIYLRIPVNEHHKEKIWDHAAGVIIVQEAGGKVTDLMGRPLDFTLGKTLAANTGTVVTNGLLHEQVLEAVRAIHQ